VSVPTIRKTLINDCNHKCHITRYITPTRYFSRGTLNYSSSLPRIGDSLIFTLSRDCVESPHRCYAVFTPSSQPTRDNAFAVANGEVKKPSVPRQRQRSIRAPQKIMSLKKHSCLYISRLGFFQLQQIWITSQNTWGKNVFNIECFYVLTMLCHFVLTLFCLTFWKSNFAERMLTYYKMTKTYDEF